MEQKRYDFDIIFNYNPTVGALTPNYNVIVNGRRYAKDQPIFMHLLLLSGGLNLFNYIGKDIAGKWDPTNKEMSILGFYP